MARRILVSVFAAALLVGACGSDDGGGGSDGADDPVVSEQPDDGQAPRGPGEGLELGDAELVEPRSGMVEVLEQPFESAEPLDDGRVLAVRYWSGVEPCSVLDRVEVDETDTAVTVTLFVGTDPDARDQACILLAKLYETRVTLDEPLGDRTVVDGALADHA